MKTDLAGFGFKPPSDGYYAAEPKAEGNTAIVVGPPPDWYAFPWDRALCPLKLSGQTTTRNPQLVTRNS